MVYASNPGMDAEEHFRRLERMYALAPINRYFQPVLRISEARAELTIPVKTDFFHAAGAVHGSVYFKGARRFRVLRRQLPGVRRLRPDRLLQRLLHATGRRRRASGDGRRGTPIPKSHRCRLIRARLEWPSGRPRQRLVHAKPDRPHPRNRVRLTGARFPERPPVLPGHSRARVI